MGIKNVLIATPCYGGVVTSAYLLSMLDLVSAALFGRGDVRLAFYTLANESLVTRARNTCVAHFLAHSEYTHLFFVDADIGFSPTAFLRALDADKDVACGIYAQKGVRWGHVAASLARRDPAQAPIDATSLAAASLNYNVALHAMSGDPERPAVAGGDAAAGDRSLPLDNGFAKVHCAATGFMCIRRSVFDRMREAYGAEARYVNDTLEEEAARHHNYTFFDCGIDPDTRQYLSEDYNFLRKWRAVGGEVWADLVSPLKHVGSHGFEGSVLDTLVPADRAAVLGSVNLKFE